MFTTGTHSRWRRRPAWTVLSAGRCSHRCMVRMARALPYAVAAGPVTHERASEYHWKNSTSEATCTRPGGPPRDVGRGARLSCIPGSFPVHLKATCELPVHMMHG